MRLSVDLGLTYIDVQIGRLLTLEVDLHGTVFVRVWGVGQVWLQRGRTVFDPWAKFKDELVV
tara:strand:+ start:3076 stop:3261 length:186 start_codon:yes stop_codon:yes gene_type:complete